MMNNPARRKQVRRAFLETLAMAGGYAVEESALVGFVNDRVRPPMTYAEQDMTIAFLRDGKFIRAAANSLDPDMKEWLVTELGRNLLTSLSE